MKILVSAYACEPSKGSEPGVGWNWANELANRGHIVTVVTRKNNKPAIEKYTSEMAVPKIDFVYHDLSKGFLFIKRILGINIYYMLWQISLIFKIQEFRKLEIDVFHHLTFGSFRNISYLGLMLKKPMIFGPVGGGEYAPFNLQKKFHLKNRIKEIVRWTINRIAFYSPIYRFFLSKSFLIVCKTIETKKLIPNRFYDKTIVSLEIGQLDNPDHSDLQRILKNRESKQLLYVGRFLYWKGIDLVLETFEKLYLDDQDFKIIFIGDGPMIDEIIEFRKRYGECVEIIKWLPKQKLIQYYNTSTLMLFPSLHDSSGNVVLEALSCALPVVSLNCGGPYEILAPLKELIVDHQNKDIGYASESLALAVKNVINSDEYESLCERCFLRSTELTWKNAVDRVYSVLNLEN